MAGRTTIGKRVGQRIRELRVAAGITQEQLAERVVPPVETETIGRAERGERVPPLVRLEAIADALGCSMDEFMAGMLPPAVNPPGTAELAEVLALLAGKEPDVVAGATRVLRAHLEEVERAGRE